MGSFQQTYLQRLRDDGAFSRSARSEIDDDTFPKPKQRCPLGVSSPKKVLSALWTPAKAESDKDESQPSPSMDLQRKQNQSTTISPQGRQNTQTRHANPIDKRRKPSHQLSSPSSPVVKKKSSNATQSINGRAYCPITELIPPNRTIDVNCTATSPTYQNGSSSTLTSHGNVNHSLDAMKRQFRQIPNPKTSSLENSIAAVQTTTTPIPQKGGATPNANVSKVRNNILSDRGGDIVMNKKDIVDLTIDSSDDEGNLPNKWVQHRFEDIQPSFPIDRITPASRNPSEQQQLSSQARPCVTSSCNQSEQQQLSSRAQHCVTDSHNQSEQQLNPQAQRCNHNQSQQQLLSKAQLCTDTDQFELMPQPRHQSTVITSQSRHQGNEITYSRRNQILYPSNATQEKTSLTAKSSTPSNKLIIVSQAQRCTTACQPQGKRISFPSNELQDKITVAANKFAPLTTNQQSIADQSIIHPCQAAHRNGKSPSEEYHRLQNTTPNNKSAINDSISRKRQLNQSLEDDSPVQKSKAIITCSLKGELVSKKRIKGGSCYHAIHGDWKNIDFPKQEPMKFELRREVPPEKNTMPLITNGDFTGSFVSRAKDPKGGVKDFRVHENVSIMFTEDEHKLHFYKMIGSGENEIGTFDILGTAQKKRGRKREQDTYDLEFMKTYTEIYGDAFLNVRSSSSNRKMREMSQNSSPSSEKSSHDYVSSVQHDDDDEKLMFETISKSIMSIPLSKKITRANDTRKSVLDLSRAEFPVSLGLGSASLMLSSPTNYLPHQSVSFPNWLDFGMLHDEHSTLSVSSGNRPPFKTPLSFYFFKFIMSLKITSDVMLANYNDIFLGKEYQIYLRNNYSFSTSDEELRATRRSCQEARRALDIISNADDSRQVQRQPRPDKGLNVEIMNNVYNLCRTEIVDNLPVRTIYTIGPSYDVLYEFDVSIKQSTCSTNAGKGAFLAYKGAKLLKESSEWKKKAYERHSKFRTPLRASLRGVDCLVTLTGETLHTIKRHDFILDDFIDTEDNITFSSKHIGCGMIELESRYAPLIPDDRKTDTVFAAKDFIFASEPSAWRYDVTEKLNGYQQVIDFTDDKTGAPHKIAESHMSMYVNEVGHDPDLVVNVQALSKTEGSVTYYIDIDEPLAKGNTVELLMNYKDNYEAMRIRRGYGKDNLVKRVKCDENDIARVQRNVQDRSAMESTILVYTDRDIVQVVNFIKDKVWEGINAAIECEEYNSNLERQWIAKRRIHWIAGLLKSRLQAIMGRFSTQIFQRGMYVFVHDWPPNCQKRPPYTGLALIETIKIDNRNKREVLNLSTTDDKWICDVPVAAVSFPSAEDFATSTSRVYAKWKKWIDLQDLPQLLDHLNTFQWDPSLASLTAASAPRMDAKIMMSLKWDVVEEILLLLFKNQRTSHRFLYTMMCHLSVSFISNCLLLVSDFVLLGSNKNELLRSLMGLARSTAQNLQHIIDRVATCPDLDVPCVDELTIELEADNQGRIQGQLVVEPNHEISYHEFLINPSQLDRKWYLVHQIALPLHKIASLIDWGTLYSVESLCEELSIRLSVDERSKFKDWEPVL